MKSSPLTGSKTQWKLPYGELNSMETPPTDAKAQRKQEDDIAQHATQYLIGSLNGRTQPTTTCERKQTDKSHPVESAPTTGKMQWKHPLIQRNVNKRNRRGAKCNGNTPYGVLNSMETPPTNANRSQRKQT